MLVLVNPGTLRPIGTLKRKVKLTRQRFNHRDIDASWHGFDAVSGLCEWPAATYVFLVVPIPSLVQITV